ncbi:hypothetical protein Zmor_006239 [Zophobas morio]|mgnify:FL=1|uniref:PHD-type domain-containing protein n=1 Tax=Zophobas morio TaxID=2755281 RepID=A0AA38IRB7_9CUCU|nr:hypothetical protein Zmor_006239 [Zophobas morio]
MAIKCRKCDKYIHRNEEYINFRKECGANYHLQCVNLNLSAYVSMKETDLVKLWGCGLCSPYSFAPTKNATTSLLSSSAAAVLNDAVLNKLPDSLRDVFVDFTRTDLTQVNTLLREGLNQQIAHFILL